MRQTIRLTEADLHRIIRRCVNEAVKQQEHSSIREDECYKKNIALFQSAYNKLYKEYNIIGTLKRKSEKAKAIFNVASFINFVKDTEGDTLYTPIWENYGGEYIEMANSYLENNVVRLRKELGI